MFDFFEGIVKDDMVNEHMLKISNVSVTDVNTFFSLVIKFNGKLNIIGMNIFDVNLMKNENFCFNNFCWEELKVLKIGKNLF